MMNGLKILSHLEMNVTRTANKLLDKECGILYNRHYGQV